MTLNSKSTIGVLVAYQPEAALFERIEKHLEQLPHIIVIENGAEDGADSALEAFTRNEEKITFLHLAENNLAKAQNMGIRAAREQGAEAVLLLDDDSDMAPEMLQNLCSAYAEGVGLIAPHLIERGNDRPARYAVPFLMLGFRLVPAAEHDYIDGAFNPVASGSLIPLSVLEQVGLMEESFGIDYIDREFCLRLLVRGFTTRVVSNAMLYHQLGKGEVHEVAGQTVHCRNHTAERRYTIFRNRLRCWARYGLAVPSFLIYDMLAATYDLIRIVGFEEDKAEKLCAAFRGALAAMTGEANDRN